MRGDSLRDFYAKSLAVMGLGVLAGVGALVDYWPVDLGTPRLTTGPAFVESLTAIDTVRVPPRDSLFNVATDPAPRVVRATQPIEAHATYRGLMNGGRPAVTFARHVGSSGVPTTALRVDNGVVLVASLPAASLSLGLPPISADEYGLDGGDVEGSYSPRVAPSLAGSDDGYVSMISGAFKKTGESIVKGSAKTGASIMDGFHAITGAFKKVPWF